MKIGIIQQHNTSNTTDNRERLISKIRNLAASGAQLVVLQELHDSLYFCQVEDVNNFDQAVTIPGDVTQTYSSVANECGIVLVDGTMAGRYRKMHIPDDPAYYEKFYFTPGDLGFEPIDTSLGRLGVLVCWDQWYPEAARLMALRGAQLLIYPTAIGFESSDVEAEKLRQREAWMTVQRGHAVANGLPVITVNRVGHEPDPSGQTRGIQFWGSSFVAGPQGELLYTAPADQEVEQIVEVDLGRSEQVRRWWPFLRDRRIDHYGCITKRYLD